MTSKNPAQIPLTWTCFTMDPYTLLSVSEFASDDEIKSAYLVKVRAFPPERSPKQFQAIRGAYELIKTEKARLAYQLFHCQDTDEIYQSLLLQGSPSRPNEEQLKQMLAETVFSVSLPE